MFFYLKHHVHEDVGLRYEASTVPLNGMSEADWALRYSTSGYIFQLSQATISWSSRRQPCVALSSCEAEIVALHLVKLLVYLTRFLADLGYGSSDPTPTLRHWPQTTRPPVICRI